MKVTLERAESETKEVAERLVKHLFSGFLKRNEKVFLTVVSNCSREKLMPIIQEKILEGSTMKAYDGLVLNGDNHYRVFFHENECAHGTFHVNGIKCFWNYAKRHLSKFNGLTNDKFILYLKESEARFYHIDNNFATFVEKSVFEKK